MPWTTISSRRSIGNRKEDHMKSILTTILGLSLTIPPVFAAPLSAANKSNLPQEPQQPDKDKQKPKPEPQQQPPPAPREPKPTPMPNEKKQEPKLDKQTEKKSKEDRKQEQKQQSRTTQQSHGRGQRIPEQKFQASFGRQHTFRPQHVQDNRRFQYSGYWFEIVEVWPADWSFDDECYIDEFGDDYFLIDTFHPGVRLLVIVVE
jgi:flagellar biosynthesis GTPase FlhF